MEGATNKNICLRPPQNSPVSVQWSLYNFGPAHSKAPTLLLLEVRIGTKCKPTKPKINDFGARGAEPCTLCFVELVHIFRHMSFDSVLINIQFSSAHHIGLPVYVRIELAQFGDG